MTPEEISIFQAGVYSGIGNELLEWVFSRQIKRQTIGKQVGRKLILR
jgi:hypothetical protein